MLWQFIFQLWAYRIPSPTFFPESLVCPWYETYLWNYDWNVYFRIHFPSWLVSKLQLNEYGLCFLALPPPIRKFGCQAHRWCLSCWLHGSTNTLPIFRAGWSELSPVSIPDASSSLDCGYWLSRQAKVTIFGQGLVLTVPFQCSDSFWPAHTLGTLGILHLFHFHWC